MRPTASTANSTMMNMANPKRRLSQKAVGFFFDPATADTPLLPNKMVRATRATNKAEQSVNRRNGSMNFGNAESRSKHNLALSRRNKVMQATPAPNTHLAMNGSMGHMFHLTVPITIMARKTVALMRSTPHLTGFDGGRSEEPSDEARSALA